MSVKTVSGERTTTVTLNNEALTVDFIKPYMYYAVRNDGSNNIYVSTTKPNAAVGEDGVVCVPSGTGYVHYNGYGGNSEVYLSGKGTVTVIAQDNGENPFKIAAGGGGSGGTGGISTYSELPDKPSIEEIVLNGNVTFEQLGWYELTEEDAENIVNEEFDYVFNIDKLLNEAIINLEYPGGVKAPAVYDSGISQSVLSSGISFAFKIEYSTFTDWQGLLGLHSNDLALSGGLGLQEHSGGYWAIKTPFGLYTTYSYNPFDDMNKKVVIIFSNNSENHFLTLNNENIPVSNPNKFSSWSPYGNIKLYQAYYSGSNRQFKETVYNAIVFNRYLTPKEAKFLTRYLLEKGG